MAADGRPDAHQNFIRRNAKASQFLHGRPRNARKRALPTRMANRCRPQFLIQEEKRVAVCVQAHAHRSRRCHADPVAFWQLIFPENSHAVMALIHEFHLIAVLIVADHQLFRLHSHSPCRAPEVFPDALRRGIALKAQI